MLGSSSAAQTQRLGPLGQDVPSSLRSMPPTRWGGWDDRDLLVMARSDRQAFAELYRRHVGGVLAYFNRVLGRPDVAFDLTAETFAAALQALPTYQPGAAPGRAWPYAIARNRLVDSIRRGRAETSARERLGMQAVVLTESGEAMIEQLIARIDGRSALELVRDLPSKPA